MFGLDASFWLFADSCGERIFPKYSRFLFCIDIHPYAGSERSSPATAKLGDGVTLVCPAEKFESADRMENPAGSLGAIGIPLGDRPLLPFVLSGRIHCRFRRFLPTFFSCFIPPVNFENLIY